MAPPVGLGRLQATDENRRGASGPAASSPADSQADPSARHAPLSSRRAGSEPRRRGRGALKKPTKDGPSLCPRSSWRKIGHVYILLTARRSGPPVQAAGPGGRKRREPPPPNWRLPGGVALQATVRAGPRCMTRRKRLAHTYQAAQPAGLRATPSATQRRHSL